MFGVLINVIAITIGGIIGTIAKEKIKAEVVDAITKVLGFFVIVLGVQGAIKIEKTLLVLFSLIIGTLIGEIININKYIETLGEFLKKKFIKDNNSSNKRFVEAFVSSGAFFAIGAMAILGSIEAGLNHDYNIFYTKSTLDFISAIMFASTMGIGVAFSSILILICQGSMTLFASFLKPMAENPSLMNELSYCGNLIIMAIGFNLLGTTKTKIANMIPAIIILPIAYYIFF